MASTPADAVRAAAHPASRESADQRLRSDSSIGISLAERSSTLCSPSGANSQCSLPYVRYHRPLSRWRHSLTKRAEMRLACEAPEFLPEPIVLLKRPARAQEGRDIVPPFDERIAVAPARIRRAGRRDLFGDPAIPGLLESLNDGTGIALVEGRHDGSGSHGDLPPARPIRSAAESPCRACRSRRRSPPRNG